MMSFYMCSSSRARPGPEGLLWTAAYGYREERGASLKAQHWRLRGLSSEDESSPFMMLSQSALKG